MDKKELSNPDKEEGENLIDGYKELDKKCDIVLEKITKRKIKKLKTKK